MILTVEALVSDENQDVFTELYIIERIAPSEEAPAGAADAEGDPADAADAEGEDLDAPELQLLECELRVLPEDLSEEAAEDQPETSERFSVTIPEDGVHPVVLYSASSALLPYRVTVLAAPYAGEGVYALRECEPMETRS